MKNSVLIILFIIFIIISATGWGVIKFLSTSRIAHPVAQITPSVTITPAVSSSSAILFSQTPEYQKLYQDIKDLATELNKFDSRDASIYPPQIVPDLGFSN
jgi:hypothetical protein